MKMSLPQTEESRHVFFRIFQNERDYRDIRRTLIVATSSTIDEGTDEEISQKGMLPLIKQGAFSSRQL